MKRVLVFAAFTALVVVPWAGALGPPTISVNVAGTSGDAGWFRSGVTVTWTINLNGESLVSLTGCQNETISSEGVHAGRSCSVQTSGGSASIGTAQIKIDWTSPTITGIGLSRGPDQAGWYNAPVGINANPTDAVSGPRPCSGSYSGPDSASASGSITCLDVAGNGSTAPTSAFQFDDTPPNITGASAARAPDKNGWYNHAVVVNFTATDNLSGPGPCAPVSYAGPDGAGAAVPSSCSDVAGNSSTGTASINYDASPPSVGGSPDRGPDANGWYARPVSVSIGGSDATSGVAGCSGGGTYSGPDGRGSVGGSCTDNAGNTGSGGVEIPYDSTAPEVTGAQADRPADANGWWNRAVSFQFVGSDAGSGVAECTRASYGGPDAPTAAVSGTCTDRAGHTSAPKQHRFKYDATPPSLSNVVVQAGNKFALLKWNISNDVASVRVTRKPGRAGEEQSVVFSGKADFFKDTGIDNRASYEYIVAAADEAANGVEQKATAVPLPALYSPAAGARVRPPIVLEWLSIERATYYNIQVWCKKRKLITTWPKRTRLVIPRSGKFGGRKYVLPRATCRWYVFPGFGRFAERRFGKLAGQSTFVVTR
jgi:hypothetical protein